MLGEALALRDGQLRHLLLKLGLVLVLDHAGLEQVLWWEKRKGDGVSDCQNRIMQRRVR